MIGPCVNPFIKSPIWAIILSKFARIRARGEVKLIIFVLGGRGARGGSFMIGPCVTPFIKSPIWASICPKIAWRARASARWGK